MPEKLDPVATLCAWLDEARTRGLREPEAMVLSTATQSGGPSARVVLFRGLTEERDIRFFTNHESRKALELAENPRAALTFHWAELERQVRVEGTVHRLSDAESDAYFAGRPRLSQIGAWVSPQSRPIGSLEDLKAIRDQREASFQGREVPRPPFWGGYGVRPLRVELWTRGDGRFHHRQLFVRDGGELDATWKLSTLAP
jgi:pyridoxamine 5'-phosphate oxidase